MIYSVKGSLDFESGILSSVCVDAIPAINNYRYASAWPRIMGVERVDYSIDVDPTVAVAAAAVIKVSSWCNGTIWARDPNVKLRSWDEDTIPTELPNEPEATGEDTWTGATARLPIYNCASLAVFAVGTKTLHSTTSPVLWEFSPTTVESSGVIRLLPADQDPNTANLADGHWMIGLGKFKEVFEVSEKVGIVLDMSPDEHVVMQVHGGEGALLISSASESYQFWDRNEGHPLAIYSALPIK